MHTQGRSTHLCDEARWKQVKVPRVQLARILGSGADVSKGYVIHSDHSVDRPQSPIHMSKILRAMVTLCLL